MRSNLIASILQCGQEHGERLSSAKVALAVVELMWIIRSDRKNDPTRSFDPSRYRAIAVERRQPLTRCSSFSEFDQWVASCSIGPNVNHF